MSKNYLLHKGGRHAVSILAFLTHDAYSTTVGETQNLNIYFSPNPAIPPKLLSTSLKPLLHLLFYKSLPKGDTKKTLY